MYCHQPGLLPGWLAEQRVKLAIAGGIGNRAQRLFAEAGVKVVVCALSVEPERVVRHFLAGSLVTGANVCDYQLAVLASNCMRLYSVYNSKRVM